MTFVERYQMAESWQEKVIVMRLYHTAMTQVNSEWTLRKTATIFECSVGLVSENIRLANALDSGSTSIVKAQTRQDALNRIERRKVWRS